MLRGVKDFVQGKEQRHALHDTDARVVPASIGEFFRHRRPCRHIGCNQPHRQPWQAEYDGEHSLKLPVEDVMNIPDPPEKPGPEDVRPDGLVQDRYEPARAV